MVFLTTKLFWGAVLILWGLSLIIEKIFKINIPVLRIIFGVILIIIGSQLLIEKENKKHFHINEVQQVQDSTGVYDGTQSNYSVVFGTSTIDLAYCRPVENTIQISAIGSSVDILVPMNISWDFDIQNIMSETTLADLKKVPMGRMDYQIIGSNNKKEPIKVHLYSVMSTIQILEKKAEAGSINNEF